MRIFESFDFARYEIRKEQELYITGPGQLMTSVSAQGILVRG